MPATFDRAVKAGGRVRTITGPNKQFGLGKGEYLHVVFRDGKMIRGEVKKKSTVVQELEKHERN